MIPPFDQDGLLPEGIHEATWDEVIVRFGKTRRRRAMFVGLLDALHSLRDAGCARAYLDGSFVSANEAPEDYDACWDPVGVDYRRIDPVLYDFESRRRAQKRRFLGELFPTPFLAMPNGMTILEYFQQDRFTGRRKGIVGLTLRELP